MRVRLFLTVAGAGACGFLLNPWVSSLVVVRQLWSNAGLVLRVLTVLRMFRKPLIMRTGDRGRAGQRQALEQLYL